MARIFTTPAKEAQAKAWMHDIMVVGGILPQSQRKENDVYFKYYRPVPATEARKICDELIKRDFADIDSEIRYLAPLQFYPTFSRSSKTTKTKPEEVAKMIVYMAECFGLYWDDKARTPYEIDVFKKTLLGEAVYKYGRVISAIKDKTSNSKATSNSGASASSSTSKNDFKQQGPKSGEARDLIGLDGGPGKPGVKVYIDPAQGYALAIRGTKPGVKSDYCAQIKPLDPKAASGSTNKVFISASHSYGMGICYFDDIADAKSFYDKLVNSGIVPDDITNLEIVRTKIDKNGYFLFGTEFGVCAISASVLNEDFDATSKVVEEDLGAGWKKATEKYTKEEYDDLCSWMHKY